MTLLLTSFGRAHQGSRQIAGRPPNGLSTRPDPSIVGFYPHTQRYQVCGGAYFFAWRALCAALSLLKSSVVCFATKSCQYSSMNGYLWRGIKSFSMYCLTNVLLKFFNALHATSNVCRRMESWCCIGISNDRKISVTN